MQKRRALSRKKYSSDVMALLVVLLSTSTIYGVVVVSIKTGFTLGDFQKSVKKLVQDVTKFFSSGNFKLLFFLIVGHFMIPILSKIKKLLVDIF